MTNNGITPEAVEAAAKAMGEVAHTRDFREMARAALEASQALVAAAIQETLAETVRAARLDAWEEGMLAQFEADLLGKPSPKNPHRRAI